MRLTNFEPVTRSLRHINLFSPSSTTCSFADATLTGAVAVDGASEVDEEVAFEVEDEVATTFEGADDVEGAQAAAADINPTDIRQMDFIFPPNSHFGSS